MTNKELTCGDLGTIEAVEDLAGYHVRPIGPMHSASMEGFRVRTSKHVFLVLIDNEQSCCESWGHIHSADDLADFLGAGLTEVRLTDTACNTQIIERSGSGKYGFDGGGIQFVDFITNKGKLQLAVYNSHNGYYGHGIVVAVDDVPLHEDTL